MGWVRGSKPKSVCSTTMETGTTRGGISSYLDRQAIQLTGKTRRLLTGDSS